MRRLYSMGYRYKTVANKIVLTHNQMMRIVDIVKKWICNKIDMDQVVYRCFKPSTRTCIFQRNLKSTKSKFFKNLLKTKIKNTHFINKIICLLKLVIFLFTHLKLLLMIFNYKIINIISKLRNKNLQYRWMQVHIGW